MIRIETAINDLKSMYSQLTAIYDELSIMNEQSTSEYAYMDEAENTLIESFSAMDNYISELKGKVSYDENEEVFL